MCKKCEADPEYKKKYGNSRYCSDWWPHGGYDADDRFWEDKKKQEEENKKANEDGSFDGW